MARKRLGPVTKTIEETFLASVNFTNVLPNAETFLPGSSSVSSTDKATGSDSTTSLLGVSPAVVFVGGIAYARLIVNASGLEGTRHLVELEAVTDIGSVFQAEVEVHVGRREPIHYLTKLQDEVFNVGIDFDGELDNARPVGGPFETVSSGTALSRDKFSGTDTSADLLNGAAQLQGSVVAVNVKAGAAAIGRHVVTLRATTDGVNTPDTTANIYQDEIEIEVE